MRLAAVARLSLVLVFTGCAGHMNVTEKMMWSTYPVITQRGMATGFVVTAKDPSARGRTVPVMVTSHHVLQSVGKGPLYVGTRLADFRGEPQGAAIQMSTPKRGQFYVKHPKFDLAAFELRIPESAAAQVSMPTFLEASSIGRGSASLRSGSEVFFLGFPEVLPGTTGAFPVLRSGRVASYPVGERMSEGLFLINADVYPGDSGAPVFAPGPAGRPQLVGMIVRRIGADARKFSHLAVAIEAGAIRETLNLLPIPATPARAAPEVEAYRKPAKPR